MQGHGIPERLRQSVFHQSEAFFALPEAEKNAIALNQSPCNRGYEPLGAIAGQDGTPKQ